MSPMIDSVLHEKEEEINAHLRNLEVADRCLKSVSSRSMLIVSKAATIIMLYGCIESVASEAFSFLGKDIMSRKLSYLQLSDKIKEEWIKSTLSNITVHEMSHALYLKKTREMVKSAVSVVSFNENSLMTSGNVDGEVLKKHCERYGIVFDVRGLESEMAALREIREARNSLAHGNTSFYEYGRNVTLDDLKEKQRRVFTMLARFSRSFTEYIKKEGHVKGK